MSENNTSEEVKEGVEESVEEIVKKIKEETKEEIVEEVKEEIVEEVKEEIVEETKEEIKEEADVNESIFITEDDVFDVKIRWYKVDNELFIEESDSEFDVDFKDIHAFSVTFKYPSQGDYEVIMNSTVYRSPDEMKIADIVQMELTRMVTLVRGWDLKQDISRMVQLDPFIIKAILQKLRELIGMKGIL